MSEKLNDNETRQSLGKLASELIEYFEQETKNRKSVLANYYGIKGMGKNHLLDLLASMPTSLLDSNDVQHPEIINIPEAPDETEILKIGKRIAEWIDLNILGTKEKVSNDLNELESIYSRLREKLSEKRDKPRFAVLINDISNLPFDDLDWFQSVVLEAIVSSPGSMVVVTSQTELNWHSWEMRNKCTSVKLPVFSQDEILAVCESRPLAQKIGELSAGHPKTVQALVDAARAQQKNLSSITENDVNDLMKTFLEISRKEIEINLDFGEEKHWLTEIFYLASSADGFDADLINDLASGFKEEVFKGKNEVPPDVTDIAWEMAYTGLASWDFDEKTYKIIPELRERIVKYMSYTRRITYSKSLEVIADSYLLRAEILNDKAGQIVNFMKYFALSKLIQGDSPKYIVKVINERVDKFLITPDDYLQMSNAIRQEKIDDPVLKSILGFFANTSQQVSLLQQDAGVSMNDNISVPSNATFKITSRKDVREYFRSLIKNQLDGKWILYIEGEGGIGKTHLLRSLKQDVSKKDHLLVNIDFHIPENRNAMAVLRKIAHETGIIAEDKVSDAFSSLEKEIRDIGKKQSLFSAGSSKEQFDKPYVSVILEMKKVLSNSSLRPIIFMDTLDPNVIELTRGFLPRLLLEFKQICLFVLAGRLDASEFNQNYLGVVPVHLAPLSDDEVQELVKKIEKEGFPHRKRKMQIDIDIVESVAQISDGNPLVLLWILFYLAEFEKEEKWRELVSQSKEQIFRYIAERILTDREERVVGVKRSARMVALKAAINFGSHFSFELFTKAVPVDELEGRPHEAVFEELRTEFFYIRGTDEKNYWTLHDRVREWLIDSYVDINPISVPNSLQKYSNNALRYYYSVKIEKLRQIQDRTAEQQDELDDLKSQQFYHRLWLESTQGDKPLQHHQDLWNYLDYLWDHYRHYQMAQVIKYCEDLQRWNFVEKDLLLADLVNAAQAWLSYSQTDYEEAKLHAERVRKFNSPHRRLKATANVVLGLIPALDPDEAFNHLESAKDSYEELVRELSSGHVSANEFTDTLDKIYPELHLVLISIGRTHLKYFDNLSQGLDALDQAYKNSKRANWKRPLYSAVALNEIARILRFQGDYTEALNKVMVAILIYKKERKEKTLFDANFGYFYETLGLIFKELSQYDEALNAFDLASSVYDNIPSTLETRKATIVLERGDVYVLKKQFTEAEESLNEAYNIFKIDVGKNPWYYLNTLNKLGGYYRAVEKPQEAKMCFDEQRDLARQYKHHLWLYWAEQSLAELAYQQDKTINTQHLENLLEEYSKRRGFEFGPAFWRTKQLLYTHSKQKGNLPEAIRHLTQGLTYLSSHWKALFWQNLVVLRNELLRLDVDDLEDELIQLIKLWKDELPEGDASHPFIQMCESLRNL